MKHSDSLNCALDRCGATCKQRKTTPTPVKSVGNANLATLTEVLESRAEKLLGIEAGQETKLSLGNRCAWRSTPTALHRD